MTRKEFALKIQLPLKPFIDVMNTIMDATTDEEFENAGCEITIKKGVKYFSGNARVEYHLECSLLPPAFFHVMQCLRNDVGQENLETIVMEVCSYCRTYPGLPAAEKILTYGPTCNYLEPEPKTQNVKKN